MAWVSASQFMTRATSSMQHCAVTFTGPVSSSKRTQSSTCGTPSPAPSVLKRGVPKTLAFVCVQFASAFRLCLHSEMRHSKMGVLGRRAPNGKPQRRLRLGRDLRGQMLALPKRIMISSCDLEASLAASACVQVLCVQKMRCFSSAFLSPLRSCPGVKNEILNPRNCWVNKAAYDAAALELREMFRRNFTDRGFDKLGIKQVM